MTDALTAARWLRARGFSVIPLDHPADPIATNPKQVGKVPALSAWEPYQHAPADDETLIRWFSNGPRNVAIVCGAVSGVVVIDSDSPEAETWAHDHLPATPMITQTPNGRHRFYRHPGVPIRNKARVTTTSGRIKLDIRADGGYCVGPNSMHHTGVLYEPLGDWTTPIEALPVFDPAWIAPPPPPPTPPPSKRAPRPPVVDAGAVEIRARAYLEAMGPAIEGQGGDAHTFRAAGVLVNDFALDDGTALALLREWNAGCVPPWAEDDLETKLRNARRYGSHPAGAKRDAPLRDSDRVDRTSGQGRDDQDDGAEVPAVEHGVQFRDFHAYMPMHAYIFAPSREVWPASSVNARLRPVPVLTADGTPKRDKDGNPVWLKPSTWLDQQQPVEQMTWIPGRPMLIRDHLAADGGWIARPDCTCFNLYRPPPSPRGDATKADRWLAHVAAVFPSDVDHLIAWFAHRVQRPHEKINHALVLGGMQGIGKDTLLEPIKAAIGAWNFVDVSPQVLLGRFNGFAKAVILRISEARDLGDVDRYAFYDRLKGYTAAPPDVLRVDEKNLREYVVWNVCGVVLTTNYRDAMYLPADDRRHYVCWSDRTRQDFEPDYWTTLYDWFADGGTQHVAAYLAAYDLTGFDPKAPPPQTEAFWTIVDANRAPEDAELADALDHLGDPRPPAVTLADLAGCPKVSQSFADWLRDRKNARQIPHRLSEADYVPVRNPAARDGLWRVAERRQVIYVQRTLSPRDRLVAATKLVEAER